MAAPEWVILDTSALAAFLGNEPGGRAVAVYHHKLAIPFITLTELVYLVSKRQGEEEAVAQYTMIRKWGRPILWPDEPILLTAARFNAQYRLGLADAYIAAFAKVHEAPLLTKDADYERLRGEVTLLWLGK